MSCKLVPPGGGETLTVVGNVLTLKLTAADTGGRFMLAEGIDAPGGGPPPHLHQREDEMFYVLDGDVEFFLRHAKRVAGPGDALWAPRNVVHTFRNAGATPMRTLVVALPCNFEEFYRECGEPFRLGDRLPHPTPESIQKLLATAPKYGLEIHPEHSFANAAGPAPAPQAYSVLGEFVRFNLTSDDTDGHFCLCTISSPPGGGPPPHAHRDCDEIFYIVEGRYEFLLGTETYVAEPGALVYVPRGNFHAYRCLGPGRGKFVSFHTPGGFENFFLDAGTPCSDPDAPAPPPDPEKVIPLILKHGMVLPPRT